MKKITYLIFASLLLMLGMSAAHAQTAPKLAYLNSNEVLQKMPEMDTVMKKFEKYREDLLETYEGMQVEYNKKAQEFREKSAEWSEVMQNQKTRELTSLVESIEIFEASLQEDLRKKQMELMEPVTAKLMDAVEAVSKENGFTYVFDTSTGAIMYVNEASAINAVPLVLKKLGIAAE